jgi:hypothetical protein
MEQILIFKKNFRAEFNLILFIFLLLYYSYVHTMLGSKSPSGEASLYGFPGYLESSMLCCSAYGGLLFS